MTKHVSIVIPTFQAKTLLEKNLPAVLAELQPDDELIVIEDAGQDETVAWLEKNIRPQVREKKAALRVVRNRHNLRFGASVNHAVKIAKNPLIFLLNNDVSVHQHCVEALVKHFEDDQVFAVGCLERETSGETHGKNKLWFERGLFRHSKAEPMTSGPTAWVIGGSGMFDRQKWLEIGGFDGRFYPAYWEDIDLSFQARQRGWKVLFEEKAVVDHNHQSTNVNVFGQAELSQISWNNSLKFTWKNGNLWQKISFILWQPYWIYQRYYHPL